MAGTVDVVLRCLTGMRARGEELRFGPALPPEVSQMRFSVHYRGHRIDVTLNQDYMEISSRPNTVGPVTVSVRGDSAGLKPGDRHYFKF